jgi:hypothetical protein
MKRPLEMRALIASAPICDTGSSLVPKVRAFIFSGRRNRSAANTSETPFYALVHRREKLRQDVQPKVDPLRLLKKACFRASVSHPVAHEKPFVEE